MMRYALPLLALAALALPGCDWFDDRPQALYQVGDEVEADREAAKELVDQLAAAKTMFEDPEAEAQYEDAKEALIDLGSGAQSVLFEELASNEDWGVRYGIVNVLSAIGTKRMVEPLIAVLDDSEPRVAFVAMQVLRVVCEHQEVPEPGGAAEGGLPPVPEPNEYDPQAQNRLWSEWHAINGSALKAAWEAWWRANKNRVEIE